MRMQIEALIRASNGRNLSIMFPLISQDSEFYKAKELVDRVLSGEKNGWDITFRMNSKLEQCSKLHLSRMRQKTSLRL